VIWVCIPLLSACTGPPALDRAILARDERDYRAALARNPQSSGEAFLAWKARQRSISIEQARDADARLSKTRNPFDANRDRDAVSMGAVVYKVSCARCHGIHADGRGPDVLPEAPCKDFHAFAKRFAVTLHRGAPRAWSRKIRDGTGPVVSYPDRTTTAMPPFDGVLSNEQIWLAVTYLQSLDIYTKPAARARPATTSGRRGND